ncbi:xaa-pro aminopeptidase [Moniliophthora roreri MCA 2997]|uniref:Xaa-pro aminopeptidase n=1 Tax=Moniliophthora roreri (strain MCA 2997) TaxID=1381753 RepID=V2X910_MONRO|nr:xaa-pro aminopeptidase [Moniliophthora roreri MCA 2997]
MDLPERQNDAGTQFSLGGASVVGCDRLKRGTVVRPALNSNRVVSRLVTSSRLQGLRQQMQQMDEPLDYYVVPTDDAHHTEYVSEHDKRREFISGFTGSAGQAIIAMDAAYLATDSRFWIQAAEELDVNWQVIQVRSPGLPKDWVEWLVRNVHQNTRVGIDPETLTIEDALRLESGLRKRNARIVYPPGNLVDKIWRERPPQSKNLVFLHPVEFAGETASSKLQRLRGWIQTVRGDENDDQQRVGTLVVSLPDIAYLLNLRGSDIEFSPLFHSYLFVGLDSATLFLDTVKVPSKVDLYLQNLGVQRKEYGEVWEFVATREWGPEGKVIISPQASVAIARALPQSTYIIMPAEVERMKAIKNVTEIEGLRKAYLRDGVCFVRFLAWLESQVAAGHRLTEWDAAEKLNELRRHSEYYQGLASENISACGPNAALPHYVPMREKARVIDEQTPYLNDSGGQYYDGTCDTTRSVHFGAPTEEQCEAYTRVLQGHIAVDTAVFPEGTTGLQLDALARESLWQGGLNYGHGSGHGFGSFLMTHEGPQGFGISVPFIPGHVVTNEPGFYKAGQFGVRIESALAVQNVKTKRNFNGGIWLGFERLTCVPIHTVMIEVKLLSADEKRWLKVGGHNLCRKWCS